MDAVNFSIRTSCWTVIAALLISAGPIYAQAQAKDPKAAALYQSRCSLCHAEDGSGNSVTGKKVGAKDLKSGEVQKLSDDELIATITKGKNKMPAFGGKLSEAQIKSVVAEIRSFAGK
jgi:cytochrome c6